MTLRSILSMTLLGACTTAAPSTDKEPTGRSRGLGREGSQQPNLAPTRVDAQTGGEATSPPAGEDELAGPVQIPPPVDDPGTPAVDPSQQVDAPQRYEHLLLRAALPVGRRYADLRYEGNNKNFRGPLEADLYRSGDETATDWRHFAAGAGGVIVLRDSLFSQQDHPVLQRPRALMMPPSWVSVAVAEVLAGRTPTPPRSAPLDDDKRWAGADIDAYFGSFPVSERLFGDASRPLADTHEPGAGAQTRNARLSMQALAIAAQAMIEVAELGPEAVASTGAEWIAASDRSYFGVELRRDKIIPIFVENPNEHEARDEGKGLAVWGRELPPEAIAITRRAVYGRRLRDGALALERYDLRHASERARAIALLEELIPRGQRGPELWLWVNGGSDGHGRGDSAVPYIADFRRQVEAADVEISRVVLLSKPSVRPWGEDGRAILEAEVDRYAKLGVPLSVQLSTKQLEGLIRRSESEGSRDE